MGLTRDALIPRVRDLLGDTPYTTTSTTTGTGGTVNVTDGTKWSEGDIGEWQTGAVGYEQFLVLADPVGNDLTVSRGYNGTTAESHASGDRIAQGPTFTGRQIQQSLDAAIRSLFPFVYRVESITLAVLGDGTDPVWWGLTPPSSEPVLGLIDASQVYATAPLLQVAQYGRDKGTKVDFMVNPPSLLSAATAVISFPSGLIHQTNDVQVRVMTAVTGSAARQDIEDTGQFPVADYCVTYTAGRLTGATEIPRVAQGADLESTGTVGTGARSDTGRTLMFDAKKQLEMLAIKYRNHYRPVHV